MSKKKGSLKDTGNYKTVYEVIPAKQHAAGKTYKVGGRELKFAKGTGAFYVKDAGLAKDLETKYGGTKKSASDDLRVIPVEYERKDPTGVHNYSFSLQHMGDWKSKIRWD